MLGEPRNEGREGVRERGKAPDNERCNLSEKKLRGELHQDETQSKETVHQRGEGIQPDNGLERAPWRKKKKKRRKSRQTKQKMSEREGRYWEARRDGKNGLARPQLR